MLLQELFTNPLSFLATALALVISLSFHEAAHAYVAKRLGDNTAELLGRLTLNPLAHLDPLGTIAILIAGIGWGKPVPVNPNNFREPKLDNLKVALAGPLSNLILALIFTGLNYLFQPQAGSIAANFTTLIIWFNILLMFFNLIPVPPLDGSKIVHLFMNDEMFYQFERIGFFILFGLIILSYSGIPIFTQLIFGPTQAVFQWLTGLSIPGSF